MGQLKYYDTNTSQWLPLLDNMGDYAMLAMNEILSGTVNGSNAVFTTTRDFTSLAVYKNGVRMTPVNDYTVTGTNQITMVEAPATGTLLTADYSTTNNFSVTGSNSFVMKQTVSGTVNGSNTSFTTASPYIGGTLQVFVNGLRQGISHVTETSPVAGTFTLDVAPLTGDIVEVGYMIGGVPSGNADTVDGFHASSSATPNTIPVLDSDKKIPGMQPKIGGIAASVFGTTGNKSITGVGFKPSLVRFTVLLSTATNNITGYGAMTSTDQFAVSSNTGAAGYGTATSETACILRITTGSGNSVSMVASYVSMDNDGFTINVTAANNLASVMYEAYP